MRIGHWDIPFIRPSPGAALVTQTSVCGFPCDLGWRAGPGHANKNPQTEVCATKGPNARPRPDSVGTRFAHWPPAGWRLRRKNLRRGGGPCPGFRRASRKGFGRWNSISDRAPIRAPSSSFRFHDLRLLAGGRGTIRFGFVRVIRIYPTRKRRAQNVRSEEIASVRRHHDDLQLVR
jgi:hypothetical protein